MVPCRKHASARHHFAVQLSDQMQAVAPRRECGNSIGPALGGRVWQLQKSTKNIRLGHVVGDGSRIGGSGASEGDGRPVHFKLLLGFEPENKKARWVSGPCEEAVFLPLVHMIR
jgi:hypothetical protein